MSDVRSLLKNTFGITPAKKPQPQPVPQAPKVEKPEGVTPGTMAAVQSMVWKDGPLPPTQAPGPAPVGPAPTNAGSDAGTVGALNPSKGWGQV